jgi:hypothetical protein
MVDTKNMQKITLKEFLSNFDFDWYKDENGKYRLEDLQRADLGEVEEDKFDTIPEVVDRLWAYYDSYILDGMENPDIMSYDFKRLGINFDNCRSYEDYYNTIKDIEDSSLDYYKFYLFYILHPDYITE